MSKISKESWFKVFACKEYQEFIREWFNLYDAYVKTNPCPPKKVEIETIDIIVRFFEERKEYLINARPL